MPFRHLRDKQKRKVFKGGSEQQREFKRVLQNSIFANTFKKRVINNLLIAKSNFAIGEVLTPKTGVIRRYCGRDVGGWAVGYRDFDIRAY